jgi:hypothetical protein
VRNEDYLKNLNLNYLAKRLVKKQGWTQEDADASVKRYKNFLLLKVRYPEINSVPTEDIDEVWHAHILHTREYTADCEAIFGKYLHHAPAKDGEEEKMSQLFEAVTRLYQKEFGEPYSLVLDVSSFW